MKTCGVGLRKIGVCQPRDSRPTDAVTVVANAAAFCFVDRIADSGGVLDAGAMTEAVARHCRLKVAAPGDFELRFDDLFAKARFPSLQGGQVPWTPVRVKNMHRDNKPEPRFVAIKSEKAIGKFRLCRSAA